jgi:hypothetical protein
VAFGRLAPFEIMLKYRGPSLVWRIPEIERTPLIVPVLPQNLPSIGEPMK